VLELTQAIPNVEALLGLEPEELGAKLLFLLRERFGTEKFYPGNLMNEPWEGSNYPGQIRIYPHEQWVAITRALSEAWAWLNAQGLVVPTSDNNPGWRFLSRRAMRFQSLEEFSQYAVARMFPKDALHPRIRQKVWMAFMRGEFDVAAFQAMKAVEVSVREASGTNEGRIPT
jgi:hypothetical protein